MPLEEKIDFGEARQMLTSDEDFSIPIPEQALRVDLACGKNKKEGFVGIDKGEIEDLEYDHNLFDLPWPFKDESVHEFHCAHFVEHIPHNLMNGDLTDGLVQFMDEVYRCLMPHGIITIISPYYTSIRAWQDPTHCRAISEVTWLYFNSQANEKQGLGHYLGKCDFEIISQRYLLSKEYIHRSEEARVWAMRHSMNVVDDLEVVLKKV